MAKIKILVCFLLGAILGIITSIGISFADPSIIEETRPIIEETRPRMFHTFNIDSIVYAIVTPEGIGGFAMDPRFQGSLERLRKRVWNFAFIDYLRSQAAYKEPSVGRDLKWKAGLVQLEIGYSLGALHAFRDLEKTGSTEGKFWAKLGVALCHILEGQYQKARKAILKLRKSVEETSWNTSLVDILTTYLAIYEGANLDEAEEYLKKSEQIAPDPFKYYTYNFILYRRSFLERKLELQLAHLQKAIEYLKNSKLKCASYLMARCYNEIGEYDKALKALNPLFAPDVDSIYLYYAFYERAYSLAALGNYDSASCVLDTLGVIDSGNSLVAYAQYLNGWCHYMSKQYSEAVDCLCRLTEYPDQNLVAHIHYYMGMAYKETGRVKEALREFQWTRSNYPNSFLSFCAAFRLYDVYRAEGQHEEASLAASQFAQALRVFAVSEKLQGLGEYVVGMNRYERKNYSSALRKFKSVYEFYKDSPLREPAVAMVLLCNNHLDRYDEAIGFGDWYLKRFPKHEKDMADWRARVLYNLGDAYYYSGDTVQAESYYKKVREKFLGSETHSLAWASLAWIFLEQGKYEQALSEFKPIQSLEGLKNASAKVLSLFGTGIAHYNLASQEKDSVKAYVRYDSALGYFLFGKATYEEKGLAGDLAYKLIDDNLYYAGMCYSRLAYYANALDSWQRLISDYPESPKAAEGGISLAQTYFLGRKYDDAIIAAKWVLQHFPNTSKAEEAHLLIAQSYYNTRQYDLAMKEYQNIKRATLSDSIANLAQEGIESLYYLKAMKAVNPQDMAMIIAELRSENPNSPKLAELYYSLGDRYMEAKDYGKTVEAFAECVARADTVLLPDVILGVAKAYYNLKDWVKSAEEYHKFSDRFKNHVKRPDALYYEGICYFNLEDFEEAIRLFNKIIEEYSISKHRENAKNFLEKAKEMVKEKKEE